MGNYRYDRLSAQDNSFLVGETPTAHMHVSGVAMYEVGDLTTPAGGVDFQKLRAHVEGVLHKIPRYRQKLNWVPVFDNPVWVDDADFNLDYHVRHTSLPRPGDLGQLKRLAGRIMAQPLDRERPLWEMWVIEGLGAGDHFAIATKVHHCMIDGISGVDLQHLLMSLAPEKEPHEPVQYVPRPAPSASELFRDELRHRLSMPLSAVRGFRALQAETEDLRSEIGIRARALGELVTLAMDPPSDTPINGPLGPHRRFDWLTVPLDDVKAVRRAAECTVNDVVLATAAGAFREYMRLRNVDPSSIHFRASAPVSMRRGDEKGSLGNRVSSWMVQLPLDRETPQERLTAIREITQELKQSNSALGVEMMMRVAEWTPPVLLSLGAQAAGSQTNTIITNVPGPQVPLYMLGARQVNMFPMAPLLENMGLAIALFSYDGRLNWGFIADYNLVPDLETVRGLVERSFVELAAAFGVEVAGAMEDFG